MDSVVPLILCLSFPWSTIFPQIHYNHYIWGGLFLMPVPLFCRRCRSLVYVKVPFRPTTLHWIAQEPRTGARAVGDIMYRPHIIIREPVSQQPQISRKKIRRRKSKWRGDCSVVQTANKASFWDCRHRLLRLLSYKLEWSLVLLKKQTWMNRGIKWIEKMSLRVSFYLILSRLSPHNAFLLDSFISRASIIL